MKELFEKGNDLGFKLGMLKGHVQNEGLAYDQESIESFDTEVKELIKEIGVWKTDVLFFMEENKAISN